MGIWYIAPPPLHVTTSDDILCPVWLIRPIVLLTPPDCRALLWVSQGPRENSPCPCPHSNHANRNASTGPTVGLIQSPRHQATTTDHEHTCAGGDSRSSTAQRALTLHSTWQASKLMSWTPHLRQFIVSPACIPFTWFLDHQQGLARILCFCWLQSIFSSTGIVWYVPQCVQTHLTSYLP